MVACISLSCKSCTYANTAWFHYREFYGALACIDGYIEKCSKGKDTSSYDKIAATVNKSISRFCKADLTQGMLLGLVVWNENAVLTVWSISEELEGNKCMEQHRPLHEQTCNKKAEEKINTLNQYDDPNIRKSVGCRFVSQSRVSPLVPLYMTSHKYQ